MSSYVFRPMDEKAALKIAAWRYEAPYDFYDTANDQDDLTELLDPQRREGAYFSAFDESGALVGFFQFEKKGHSVEVGLGLRPDLTGKRLGLGFLRAGLEFARRRFSPEGFRLTVATFNERAIRVYERAGFRHVKVFMHYTNGAEHPFLLMTREA
jgi:[ribosomal protein S18]-alanine N-acetyltransferase